MARAQAPVRTVAPAATPVSLAEAKEHLRVDHTAEDTLIQIYLDAAVSALDGWSGQLGRALVTQTWRQDFDAFPPSDMLRLPFPDAQSVSVAYTDENGSDQTLATSEYHLVQDYTSSAIELAENSTWPNTDDVPDAVRVTTVVGYGDAADVPADLKAAILIHIGHMYENRESVSMGVSPATTPLAYNFLISKYRRLGG